MREEENWKKPGQMKPNIFNSLSIYRGVSDVVDVSVDRGDSHRGPDLFDEAQPENCPTGVENGR